MFSFFIFIFQNISNTFLTKLQTEKFFFRNRRPEYKLFELRGNNSETKSFFDNIFQLGVIPIVNKPTRITPTSITAIDNILTNSFFDLTLKTGIIKTDISDHFPIYFSTKTETSYENVPSGKYYKRIVNDTTINNFKDKLSNLNWDDVTNELNADSAYNKFITTFVQLYDEIFPLHEYQVKEKSMRSPWISSSLKKSSKQKQKLYIKYLKKRTEENLTTYKDYTHLFEKIKKQSKKYILF